MMIRKFLIFIVGIVLFNSNAFAQQEPLAKQIKSKIQHEAFTVNVLVQEGFRFSLKNDDFQGGRTFEAANARLSFRGTLDGGFYYRLFFNVIQGPSILDAYIGYKHSNALRITAGAMKPKQTQDYIPDPGSLDFVDRTRITGLIVQSREVGLSLTGDIDGFYYYGGVFNGTGLSPNNNNSFYGIGRLQYTFVNTIPGSVSFAIQGSQGNSPGVRSGAFGPILRGERKIYGGDVRVTTARFLFAAEYLAGSLQTEDIPDKNELISGYYFTTGYSLAKETMILGRLQSWGYREQDFRDYQLTFGINHSFTSITSYQFNFDAYFPDTGSSQYGFSILLQVQF